MSRTQQEDAVIAFRRWLRRRYPGIGVVLDPSKRTVIVTSLLAPAAAEVAELLWQHPERLHAIPGITGCYCQCFWEGLGQKVKVRRVAVPR